MSRSEEFTYCNVSQRRPGRWLSAASRVLPGIGRVQAQIRPYAQAWRESNLRALAAGGPVWVVLGDSLSQSIGASAYDRGWVGQLNAGLTVAGGGYRVLNLSVSGARIQDVLDQQLPALDQAGVEPALVTLLVGSNDMFAQRVGVADRLAELLRTVPAGTVVATLPNPSRTAQAINATIVRVAAERGLVVAETREPRTNSWRGKLAADYFHPNDIGYASIAEVFADTLRAADLDS